MQPFPLPSLEPLIGIQVPVYDLSEFMSADQAAFLDKVGYVADNASKVRTITIWMIVLTCLCFIAGVVAAIMYKAGGNKDSSSRESEVAREEAT